MSLITTPNMADRDAAYARMIAAHKGLSEVQSTALNARLILVLMNHVGDQSVLDQAIALAKAAGR